MRSNNGKIKNQYANMPKRGQTMRRKKRKSNSASGPEMTEKTQSRGTRIVTDLSAILILVLITLGIVYRKQITVEAIVSFTPSNLWLAALVFMGLYALKSLTTVVYVKLLYLAAGLVFPLPIAILVNIAGSVVQFTLPYLLGRVGGRGTADFIVKRHPKLGRISALRNRSNFWFSTFVRAVGLFPADPVSIYFGACGMPYSEFLLGSLAGTLPILIVSTIVGTSADDPGSAAFIVSTALFIGLQVGAGLAFYLWIRKNNAAISEAEKEKSSNESSQ